MRMTNASKHSFLARFSCLMAIIATLVAFGGAPAFAGVDQDGRKGTTTTIDGASIYINGDKFLAPSSACILYSLLVFDQSSSGRQVETGIVRCNGATIDGTCTNGYAFAERYNGSSYFCNQGLDFNNNYDYYAKIERTSLTSTSMAGSINGASTSQSGFVTTHSTVTYAWGEVTGGTHCPGPGAHGLFDSWTRKVDSTWATVQAQSIYGYISGINDVLCWGVGPYNLSTGAFDVLD